MKRLGLILSLIICVFVLYGCGQSIDSIDNDNTAMASDSVQAVSNTNKVHFIDVGQGDSILVESNGEYMLVDAGEEDKGYVVVNYINNMGIKSLKYAVATHPHSDHIGGMDDVLKSFKVENIIMPNAVHTTRCFENLLDAIEANNVNVIEAKPGSSFDCGNFKCNILGPVNKSDDMNNNSVVLKLALGNDKILLTGDCSKEEENDILNNGGDLSANVLKAGHHGSSTSSTEGFVKSVNPSVAVISCGKDNDYGHPHRETMDLFNKLGIKVYRTDESGTIIAECSGNGIKFLCNGKETQIQEKEQVKEESTNKIEKSQSQNFIINKKSKKFHKADCGSAAGIKNKEEYTGSADELIARGYSPCGNCNPDR